MSLLNKLSEMAIYGGSRQTRGLSDPVIRKFLLADTRLREAIETAHARFKTLEAGDNQILKQSEQDQVRLLQSGIVNFYPSDAVNPYVALAAKGPWVVTSKGAVIHDNGGYGMLGFGHDPEDVLGAMGRSQVMANVMTASFSQHALVEALQGEIGQTKRYCPYSGFLFLNSGSEAVSLGARISDIGAKLETDPGAEHEGRRIVHMALKGGFHGRTDRPAQYSDSTRRIYQQHLASFARRGDFLTVEPNNLEQLQQHFDRAQQGGYFIESLFMEPVMGEGNPGLAISREFYDLARKLTLEHGALLLVDSIQAGLRAQGVLSIVDYPGFEDCTAPDMETFSKALNAGQYPLSVLAVNNRAEALYRKGVYGNTMTANPRAMDVACQVLQQFTPELRENIRARGDELVQKLSRLAQEMGGLITQVQGTGLLCSCELHPSLKSYGAHSIEEYLRHHGLGVIHGGRNALRFTPHFRVTSEEIDLIVKLIRQALIQGPRATLPMQGSGT